jgi:hypothetical protein
MPDRSEMDKWLIGLDPNLKAAFDATYDMLETTKKALPASKDGVNAAEEKLIQQSKQLAQPKAGQPAAAPKAGPPAAQNANVPVGGSHEVVKELKYEKSFDYCKITLTGTAKASIANANAGATAAVGGGSTKLGPKGNETTVAMGASVGLGDFDLFQGVDIADVKLTFLNVFGSSKFSVSFSADASVSFPQIKQSVGVSGKVTLLEVSGEEISALEASIGVTPFPFEIVIKGVKVKGECSFEASIKPDKKKLALQAGKKVGEKIVLELAEKELKEKAAEEGVKFLGKEAAGQVLSKFGPVMTAFSVGWTIGDLLTRFTDAGLVAEKVDESMMGDFNDQWNEAGTAKKVYLGVTNAPKIAATLVVSGVVGVGEGIGEVASKGYHAAKDYISGPEIDQEALNKATKVLEEEMDKRDMEEEERELYPQQSVAHDDPPPPPPPKSAPPQHPKR